MSMNITIMTTIMKTTIMSMITNIIMNMTRTAPADATITKNMSMITTTTMNTITIMKTTTTNMNIITIMKTMTTTMSTIMNMTKTAPADAMTMSIIITIMQMKCLQAGAKETPHKFTKEKIEDVLKTLCETDDYGTILRAKGMVEDENGTWIYFDMVPGEYELRDGEPDYTGRLCVIGRNIDEHRLEELFGI